MTPDQQNKIEAIKSALRQHIEEAEKGEQYDDALWSSYMRSARTMSPLACRIALAGIEALEETAIKDDINSRWWSTANIDLETIIFIWEREYDLF